MSFIMPVEEPILRSKRHIWNNPLALFFLGFFALFIIVVFSVFALGYMDYDPESWKVRNMGIFISALLGMVVVWLIYNFRRHAHDISIFHDRIHIGADEIEFHQIQNIELLGQADMRFLYISNFFDAVNIRMKSGKTISFFDMHYRNNFLLKQCIDQVFNKRKKFEPYEMQEVRREDVKLSERKSYNGYHLFSLFGFGFWFLHTYTALTVFDYLHGDFRNVWFVDLIAIGLMLFMFWFFTSGLHYFQVTDEHLIIRKHIAFWYKKTYKLDDIIKVQFGSESRMPTALILYTKDYKKRFFHADTLWKKHWKSLRDDLRRKKVKTGNLGAILF
jgi:hypothetical protein